MLFTNMTGIARPSVRPRLSTDPPKPPQRLEPVLLVHGTFANSLQPERVHWWQPGSDYARELDTLLLLADSKARCWSHLAATDAPFAWSGANTESARKAAGRALAADIAALEADPRISRYHLVAHSHGGNVVVNAMREFADPPAKLGAVVYMGTPYLSFHHATPLDPRWISVPMYLAAAAGCVWSWIAWPDSHVVTGIAMFGLALALLAEFLWPAPRGREPGASLYGSGRPRAFAFADDEAISGLASAEAIALNPRAFVDQFTQSTPAPAPAVKPRDPPTLSFGDEIEQSGVYTMIHVLEGPQAVVQPYGLATPPPTGGLRPRVDERWRSLGSLLDQASAGFPLKTLLVLVLWLCLLLPRLAVAAVSRSQALLSALVGAVVLRTALAFARGQIRLALPIAVRKAAFGADLGRFIGVALLPPGVTESEPIGDELRKQCATVAQRLGGIAGQALLGAVARRDAFAIKAYIERALSDASLLHSYYYQAPAVIAATAGFIAEPEAQRLALPPGWKAPR